MAILATEGFDWQASASDLVRVPGVATAVGLVSGSLTFVTGVYGVGRALWINAGGTDNNPGRSASYAVAVTPTSTVYIQADINPTFITSQANLAFPSPKFIDLLEGSTALLSFQVTSSGAINALLNTTVIATSSAVLSVGNWTRLDIRAVIADSGGTIEIWTNGVSVLSFTGDTRNGGATGQVNSVRFGARAWDGSNAGPATSYYLDNVVIQDATGSAPYNAPLPPVIVDGTLRPDSDVSVQGTPSSGASNFVMVDEAQLDTADFVTFSSPLRDRYGVSNLTTSPANVYAVKVLGLADATVAGPRARANAVLGANRTDGTERALGPSDSVALQMTARPGGGAWTAADVNALQVEFERTL